MEARDANVEACCIETIQNHEDCLRTSGERGNSQSGSRERNSQVIQMQLGVEERRNHWKNLCLIWAL